MVTFFNIDNGIPPFITYVHITIESFRNQQKKPLTHAIRESRRLLTALEDICSGPVWN